MGVSTYSTVSLEDVRCEGGANPYAFQLSIMKDRGVSLAWIKRAEGKRWFFFVIHDKQDASPYMIQKSN